MLTGTTQLIRDVLTCQARNESRCKSQDEKLLKLACLYEICHDMMSLRSIDDLCMKIIGHINSTRYRVESRFPFIEIYDRSFAADNFKQNRQYKVSVQIVANEIVCGQIGFFYKDATIASETEDRCFLEQISEDLGVWLERQEQAIAQEALLNEVRVMEEAIDKHSIIAITDRKGSIKYVNEQFCNISKYSANELLGQNHRIINSGYHSKEFIRHLWSTISSGVIWKGEFKNRAKDGSFYWVDTTIVPFLDHTGVPYQYVAIRTVITEHKLLEQRMVEQVAELARSNDELEQFAYVVTHDLQEPLRAVSGFVQLLKKRYDERLDEQANELIAHTVAGTKRMQRLIDDLLTYAQVNANQSLEEIDCNQLLKNILIDLSVIICECGADITCDHLPVIKGVSFQFIQLFTNLINNALKFRSERSLKIHIGIEENADEWIFSVADNGIGIESQYLERIFRVFQRLHSRKEYAGMGIGLAICKKVVEHHGGRIWVKSESGQGSVFYFTISKVN